MHLSPSDTIAGGTTSTFFPPFDLTDHTGALYKKKEKPIGNQLTGESERNIVSQSLW